MSPIEQSVPARRKRRALRSGAEGLATAGAFLVGVEIGLRVIAEGHTNPDVRLFALASSVGVGAIVAHVRGTSR